MSLDIHPAKPPHGERRRPARVRRLAACGVMLVAAFAALGAHAGPGVSSTRYSDMPAGDYVSDQAHTSVTAKVLHLGFSRYTLRFDKVEAQFRFDPASPTASRITVSIDPASIDTGAKSFNEQLAGKGWFDSEDFPKITFVSDQIDPGDGVHGTVSGYLTLHGVTKPVTLEVTFNGVGADLIPFITRVGFSANTTIKRSDFGLSRFAGLIGDEVQLCVEVEFTKKVL
jgi:polyisoprenoid-binding protein YceI